MEAEEGKNKYSKEFKVPPNFDEVLRGLTREILRNQPEDISKFGMTISYLYINYYHMTLNACDFCCFHFISSTAYEYFSNELQARALASD